MKQTLVVKCLAIQKIWDTAISWKSENLNPHRYLALKDSNQNYVHDTPAQAVPSRQVSLPVVQKMWNIHFLSSWAFIVILTLKMATLLHGTTAHKEAPQYHIWLQRG